MRCVFLVNTNEQSENFFVFFFMFYWNNGLSDQRRFVFSNHLHSKAKVRFVRSFVRSFDRGKISTVIYYLWNIKFVDAFKKCFTCCFIDFFADLIDTWWWDLRFRQLNRAWVRDSTNRRIDGWWKALIKLSRPIWHVDALKCKRSRRFAEFQSRTILQNAPIYYSRQGIGAIEAEYIRNEFLWRTCRENAGEGCQGAGRETLSGIRFHFAAWFVGNTYREIFVDDIRWQWHATVRSCTWDACGIAVVYIQTSAHRPVGETT